MTQIKMAALEAIIQIAQELRAIRKLMEVQQGALSVIAAAQRNGQSQHSPPADD